MNPNSPSHAKIGRATLLNMLGTVVPGLLMLLTVPLYIRTIGSERYGVLTLVWLIIGYFGLFDLGFGRALTNRLASLPPHAQPARQDAFWAGLTLSLATGIVGGLVLYGLGHYLLDYLIELPAPLSEEFRRVLPWVILALPLSTTLSVLSGALMGQGAFLSMNTGQIMGSLLFQLLPLVAALMVSPTLNWLIPAALLGRTSSLLMMVVSCHQQGLLLLPPRLSRSEIVPLFRYGGWVTVTALAGPLLTVFDRFVIGTLRGANAVTAYTIPFNLVNIITILPASLQKALTPDLTAGEDNLVQRQSQEYTRVILAFITPAVAFTMLLMQPFLDFWIGTSLAKTAAPVGILLLPGIWINALAFIPFTALQCRGRPDIPARFHLWELFPYVAILWGLTHQFGVQGAALAWDLRVLTDTLLLFQAADMTTILRQGKWAVMAILTTFAITFIFPYTSPAYSLLGGVLMLSSLRLSWTALPPVWRHWFRFPR